MTTMNFQVAKEAAGFATEAHIHHMCTVANLIRACCFEGLANDLVTSLGPERFTEWKAALINEAAGKLPRLFGTLESDVRDGKFEPLEGALQYGHATPGYDINELVDKDRMGLRKVLKGLRRAELIAAREHDRVRAAARDIASAQAQHCANNEKYTPCIIRPKKYALYYTPCFPKTPKGRIFQPKTRRISGQ
jgi:hypothetical protein